MQETPFRPRPLWPRLQRIVAVLLAFGALATATLAQTAPEPVATSEAERSPAIEAEIVRAEAALEELHRLEAVADSAAGSEQATLRESLDRLATLQARLPELRSSSEAIDRFYDTIVEQLVDARDRLRTALDDIRSPVAVPTFAPDLDLEDLATTDAAERLRALDAITERIRETAARLETATRERRLARVGERWELVRLLNNVRIQTLTRLSDERRGQVLGLSRDGIAQLQRELDHLVLVGRAYLTTREGWLRDVANELRDPFLVGAATWAGFKVLLILLAFWALRRRGERIHDATLKTLHSWSPRNSWHRRCDRLLGAASVVAPWLLALAMVLALQWAVGAVAAWPEAQLAVRLAVLWIVYRMIVDALVATIVSVVRHYRFEFGAVRTVKLLRSVRAVIRVVFAVAVLLSLSEVALGRGYLYHVALRFSWIALLVAVLLVFLRWKPDIVDTYLKLEQHGPLRQRVESSRERWHGGFLAAAALAVLAFRALTRLTRDFAMGFDQTRRALAFLLRRRIEQQAQRTGYAGPEDMERLPAPLLEALDPGQRMDDRFRIDHFPGLEDAEQAISTWADGGGGGSFLLAGDIGIGRTAWLGQLKCGDVPLQQITFTQRLDSDRRVAATLGEALGCGPVESTAALRDWLIEQPPRVVMIDRGQNLMLGKVGGYEGFESFMSLVDETTDRVFWVVAFSQLAWEHIVAVHPQLAGFRRECRLAPWPEEQIRELIRRRVEASGVTVDFTDVSLDAMDDVPYRVRAEETEAAYTRLLWDTSMGLPRVALEYWKRSLVPDENGSVRVRLFRPPAVDELERLGDVALFLLAALMTHESLTTSELAVVSRYSERLCSVQVARLTALGTIVQVGDRQWVTPFWQPAVRRLLKRRNLLSD